MEALQHVQAQGQQQLAAQRAHYEAELQRLVAAAAAAAATANDENTSCASAACALSAARHA